MCPSTEPDQKTAPAAPSAMPLFWVAYWDPIHCPGGGPKQRIRFGKVVFLVAMLVALDCPLDTCFTYIYQYEPYLKDPVVFPRITMLVYLFYALPLLAAFIYGLRNPGCTWMLDWAIFFAGAIAQTQWCHIGGSLHSRTPFTYRVPTDKLSTVMILNGLYVAVPILLAIRCRLSPTFFMPTVPEGQTSLEKKDN